MRTKTIIILSVVMTICSMAGCFAQEKTATNRYSMKLTRNDDGTYSLQKNVKGKVDFPQIGFKKGTTERGFSKVSKSV